MSALSSSTPALVCGGLSFHEAPVEIREQAAFREEALAGALARLRETLGLGEAVLISTCNRVEYFGIAADPEQPARRWAEFLDSFREGVEPAAAPVAQADFAAHSFHRTGRPCVEHLFRLAAGLDSMVVGETEILGQIKEAYRIASEAGMTGKRTNRLFQSSFAAAKAVRSQTRITRGTVSVGSVAVELAERLFGQLRGRTVMVLGAGATSERTARSLQSRGVSFILVANRTHEKAEKLAGELGGEAVLWDRFEERVEEVDIVISSTSAPHYVLTRERLEQVRRRRSGRPLFLIDLAVPRDIEPGVNFLEDVYLYDIDDLESIARANQKERSAEAARCERILDPHVDRLMEWVVQLGNLPGPGADSDGLPSAA